MSSIEQEVRTAAKAGADRDQTPVTVAVVEDSSTVRRNLNRWLDRTPGFKCVLHLCQRGRGVAGDSRLPAPGCVDGHPNAGDVGRGMHGPA